MEEVHDADTPTRQAQRAMLAEREAATAKHAASNEDVLGMRLQAVSTSAEAEVSADAARPQPHARRISGASKSFSPNDKMCVMCKFLTERMQQDLSIGFGAHGAFAYGGAGMPPYAMISAVPAPAKGGDSFMEVDASDEEADLVEIDSEEEAAEAEQEEAEEEEEETDESLIQLEASEAEEEEEESESEEEAEEESEEEEEAEEEDASFMQMGSEDETEWTTPEYSAADAAAAAVEPALLETAGEDFQSPAYIDAVYQTSEDSTADEAEEAESEEDASEGTADSAEPSFFESSAVAGTEEASEWATPEYVGAPATEPLSATESVEAELTSFVETASEDEWTTPSFDDNMKAESGAKAYARVIVPAEHEISLVEAAATESVRLCLSPRLTLFQRIVILIALSLSGLLCLGYDKYSMTDSVPSVDRLCSLACRLLTPARLVLCVFLCFICSVVISCDGE